MSGPRFTADEIRAATGGRWVGPPPPEVAGVFIDSRAPSPGACFVALKGERFDAHDFLAEVGRSGASCAIVAERWLSHGASPPPRLPLLAVPDPLRALGALAHAHRLRHPIPLVAVTGSNGKTTTREMIACILSTRGPTLRPEGNLNNEVGVPLTLFRLGPEPWAAVVEMGTNHPGEIARLAAMALPQVGVVTNAAPAHLEGLGSIEAVADAKAELYRALPPSGIAVVNADDARMLARAKATGRRLLTFAAGRGCGDVAVLGILSHTASGLSFVLGIGNREVEVTMPLLGEHNAANAAAAAAATIALGCTDREIAKGLSLARPVGRRLRVEQLASGLSLVDDCYNANPASMSAALRTLSALSAAAGARPVAVLGDMLELGPAEAEAHRALGTEAARSGVKLLAAFGPRSRAARDAAVAAGLPAADAFHTEEIDALVAWARERLEGGDVLLVKASRGMKLERLVEALR